MRTDRMMHSTYYNVCKSNNTNGKKKKTKTKHQPRKEHINLHNESRNARVKHSYREFATGNNSVN